MSVQEMLEKGLTLNQAKRAFNKGIVDYTTFYNYYHILINSTRTPGKYEPCLCEACINNLSAQYA